MALPSDIVLFGGDILGKGGQFGKPLIIRVSRKEAIISGKTISREEAKMGKSVVFGANSRHKYIHFWENTLNYGSCNKKRGNRPENHCFQLLVTSINTMTIRIISKYQLKYRSPKFV